MQTTQRLGLSLMLLGSKRRHRSSYASPAPSDRRLRSLARHGVFSQLIFLRLLATKIKPKAHFTFFIAYNG
ncbi:hypothetical protein EFP34_02690 [Lacticaseibacillus paracasei]|nr:hypothetical protein [Lacticaseibacillus paracasei]